MSKRRRFTPEFKAQVVLDVLSGQLTPAEACRRHALSPNLLSLWRATFLRRAPAAFRADDHRTDEQARIAELERLVGRLTLEHEILKSLDALGPDLGRRREAAMSLAEAYPAATVCRLLDLPRSSFYSRGRPGEDDPLRAAVLDLAGAWPTYGYRRLTAQLRRAGHSVNGKRVRRLMHELGLAAEPPARKPRTTDSEHRFARHPNLVEGLAVARPDQVWAGDITYIRLRAEFVYLAVLMDVFTRSIRGWELGRSLDGGLALRALRRALSRGRPEIHHSDQGVQYAATAYIELLTGEGVAISMAAVGRPEENGYAERLMRTIKEEEVDLTEYEDLADARRQLGRFLDDVYNTERLHSSLGYLTPAEFEERWIDEQRDEMPILS